MKRSAIRLDSATKQALIDAARNASPVTGLTHNHYKYPARFSPLFVSTAITAFTKAGDHVFDPFVGGGTTLVEALVRGRQATGVDISTLATFVSEAKTLILRDTELESVRKWAERLPSRIDMHRPTVDFSEWEEAGYHRNLSQRSNWRLKKAIEQALGSSDKIRSRKARKLARCVILRTAQWALDGRKALPSVDLFRSTMVDNAVRMIASAREFRNACAGHKNRARCINVNVTALTRDELRTSRKIPKLLLTSPPYPGIHVLYHRWQVDGRKETPAPFWIANKLDGAGLSYYTMGDRKNPGLRTYFDNMLGAFCSISACVGKRTIIVQMLAFSEPEWQLPRYLAMMVEAGFNERLLGGLDGDGRLWRTVPNRRWYAEQRGETSGSQEVVLFHQLAEKSARPHKRAAPSFIAQSPSA